MNDLDAIATAARLQQMGIEVRSAGLAASAKQIAQERQVAAEFAARGGNRAMRRAKKRQR